MRRKLLSIDYFLNEEDACLATLLLFSSLDIHQQQSDFVSLFPFPSLSVTISYVRLLTLIDYDYFFAQKS